MEVLVLETSSLGDRSYLATDGSTAVVVDPQRDIDRVLDLAAERGVAITHVLETHVHNDYVSGGLELSRTTGAEYVLPRGSDVEFRHTGAGDGDVLEAGTFSVRALLTPGHTHSHTSYVLTGPRRDDEAVFTGGSLLHGSTGRTDLVGDTSTDALTHAQYRSVQRLARELPAGTTVLPTHGFGSFCAATPTSGTSSTIADQLRVNPALTMAEQDYVDGLLAGLVAYPAYYARMAPTNRRGPTPVDLSMPTPVDGAELRRRIDAGEVVDLADRRAFAAGHLQGSLGFELSDAFVTYLGWLHRSDTPLTLVGASADQVLRARRELVRIGIDEIAGAAVGDGGLLAGAAGLSSYAVSDFAGLARPAGAGTVLVLDTRRHDERSAGHLPGSLHVALHELPDRLAEIADGEVWVHCASGYRASIAASILDRPGRQVVLVDDTFRAHP